MTAPPEPTPTAAARDGKKWARLAALAALFVGSLIAAKVTGLEEHLSVERVRAMMDAAGAWGFLAFLGVFAAGELMHVPGLVFVGAASVAYGKLLGVLASYLGALVSVTVSFFVVRTIGGQPLGDVQRPFVKRMLDRLGERPVRTVAVLRFFFWMAPPLNYALAMSRVRFREYLAGSALGLAVPVVLAVLFFDWLAALFG